MGDIINCPECDIEWDGAIDATHRATILFCPAHERARETAKLLDEALAWLKCLPHYLAPKRAELAHTLIDRIETELTFKTAAAKTMQRTNQPLSTAGAGG